VGWKRGASLSVPHNDSYTYRPPSRLVFSGSFPKKICGTYLISIVDVQEGGQIGGKEYLEDLVHRRWLFLCHEIGQCAAEQRHARRWHMLTVALDGPRDVAQALTLAPRRDFLPRIRMRQIRIRSPLRLLKLVQRRRQPGEQLALVCLERAAGERRLRKAGKQESLAGPKRSWSGAEPGGLCLGVEVGSVTHVIDEEQGRGAPR
jgi:hypothetical protein